MLLALRTVNAVLLLALVACIAGAIAGLIIFAPFILGAWFLNLMALLGWEQLIADRDTEPAKTEKEGFEPSMEEFTPITP